MDTFFTPLQVKPIKYSFFMRLKQVFERENIIGGRPTKFTEAMVGKLRTAYIMGSNDSEACSYAEISRDTLHEWRKKYPEFSDKIEAWKSNPFLKAKATIYKNLDDAKTAMWYLERRDRENFGIRHEITSLKDLIPEEVKIIYQIPQDPSKIVKK